MAKVNPNDVIAFKITVDCWSKIEKMIVATVKKINIVDKPNELFW